MRFKSYLKEQFDQYGKYFVCKQGGSFVSLAQNQYFINSFKSYIDIQHPLLLNKKRIYQEKYRFVFRLVNTSYLYRTNTKLYQICAKTKYMNVIPSIFFQIREGLKDCTIRIYHVCNRLVRALCYTTIFLTVSVSIDTVVVKISRTPIDYYSLLCTILVLFFI